MSDFSFAVQMLASLGGATAREPDPTPKGPRQKRLLSFSDLSAEQVRAIHDYVGGDEDEYNGEIEPWEEEDVVQLCWLLLESIDSLQNPRAPVIDKIWILNWMCADPTHQKKPFSFDFCVRVVCLSPLSHLAFIGRCDIDDLREQIRARTRLRESILRYPNWVQEIIKSAPDFVVAQLDRDPQFVNKQIRRRATSQTADMFG